MVNWASILLIAILIFLFYLYSINRITGKTLAIIIMAFIILILIIPSILGFSVMAVMANMCMNKKCDQVKLPFDIDKIGPFTQDPNWMVYNVNTFSGQPVTQFNRQ